MTALKDKYRGFTLVELLVSATILVITLSFGMAGFVYFLRSTAVGNIQNELDIDVQTAMERIKYDIRLSSLDEMFYYPAGAGPYKAISFPMAYDDDGDGAIELDANTNIIWDATYIYHVWSGSPNELRLTIFDPRDNSLTDAERQEQINSVVETGSGSSTHNGDNSSSTVVFANLFDWSVSPNGAVYDGYSPIQMRDKGVSLGSIVLSNGTHTLTFETVGKNSASSGYKIGVDTLFVSPCYGEREAEAQLPVSAQSGATASAQDMTAQGSWSGNYQLSFPATAVGQTFSLTIENDLWEETNFRGTGSVFDDTKVEFNTSISPKDFVVALDGAVWPDNVTWRADSQTGDLYPINNNGLRGAAIRVLIRGEDMLNGGWIKYNGTPCYVSFRAGSISGLTLKEAYFAEVADHENPTMDINPGTQVLLFNANKTISSLGTWIPIPSLYLEKEKSYIVSFLVSTDVLKANVIEYKELIEPSMINSYIIPFTSAPTSTDLAAANWSSRSDVIATNSLYGVYLLWSWLPTNGQFVSQIIDTKQDSPNYTYMSWNATVPSGSSLALKIRSGNSNDLSDAQSWTNIAAMSSAGSINPGDKRYFQFLANLKPTANGVLSPLLKDVTVKWTGVERYVDIGGTFSKGPDYGIFKVKVDGKDIKTGVIVDLEIFETARGVAGENKKVTSSLISEVTPRNTGL